ncbi:MAG: ribosome-associated translation inhibitor RaiA [Cardiobacteriaceae bacterium]|nr:ribosome-associated translation inhibitor RaiA [Cardiobacteriaceae bacterium]
MQFNLTGKHLDISDAMREQVGVILDKLAQRHPQVNNAQVTLQTEKHEKIVDATLHLEHGGSIHGTARHDDMYQALNLLEDVLEKQLRRSKGRAEAVLKKEAAHGVDFNQSEKLTEEEEVWLDLSEEYAKQYGDA